MTRKISSSPKPSWWGKTADVHRSTYRIFCVLAGVLNPLFGLVLQATDPTAVDPHWGRLVLSVVVLLLLSLSYMVRWVEENFIGLVRGYFYVLMTYIAALTTLNGFSPNYTMGMLFTFMGVGVAFSLGLSRRVRPLLAYLVFTVVLTLCAGLLVSQPEVSVWIMWACVVSTAIIIYVVASAKIKAEGATEASERRYQTLMDAANDAIIIADPNEGSLVDVNQKALELLGRTTSEVGRMHFADLFPLHDRERTLTLFERHVFEKAPINEDVFILARDGQTVAVDPSAGLIDVDGQELIQIIFRDATERHRYEEQLIQAKERAEELLRIKTSLLNNMSHELRTPITSILGFAEIITEETIGDHREHAEHILLSTRRLHDTVNSVLGLAQLEGGEPLQKVELIRVAPHLSEAVSLFRPLAHQKGLTLRFVNRADNAAICADVTGLQRTVNNLLGNAIKFTERGEVEVELSASAERVIVRIRDTGVGISAAFLPRIFDEFQQESSGLDRSHEGSGLGLAITRRVVELMGGTIEVESEKGRGSIFTVAFSRVAVPEEVGGDGETPDSVFWISNDASPTHLRRVAMK